MTLKFIFSQSFRQSISDLVFGINREYLDESLAHMFAKVMVTNIDVLGSWAQLSMLCKF
jgi:hypothetical protein